MTVLTVPEITSSTAVAMTFGNKLLTPFQAVMPLGVAISAFGCAMAYQFGISRFRRIHFGIVCSVKIFRRLCYAAAQEGHIPQSISFLNVTRLLPSPAVVLQVIVATEAVKLLNV